MALIFHIEIRALLKVNLNIEIPSNNLNDQNPNKTETSNPEAMVNQATNSLFSEIESFMKTKQPFLNPDLNLKVLSRYEYSRETNL